SDGWLGLVAADFGPPPHAAHTSRTTATLILRTLAPFVGPSECRDLDSRHFLDELVLFCRMSSCSQGGRPWPYRRSPPRSRSKPTLRATGTGDCPSSPPSRPSRSTCRRTAACIPATP